MREEGKSCESKRENTMFYVVEILRRNTTWERCWVRKRKMETVLPCQSKLSVSSSIDVSVTKGLSASQYEREKQRLPSDYCCPCLLSFVEDRGERKECSLQFVVSKIEEKAREKERKECSLQLRCVVVVVKKDGKNTGNILFLFSSLSSRKILLVRFFSSNVRIFSSNVRFPSHRIWLLVTWTLLRSEVSRNCSLHFFQHSFSQEFSPSSPGCLCSTFSFSCCVKRMFNCSPPRCPGFHSSSSSKCFPRQT